jgi:hypothetical protein
LRIDDIDAIPARVVIEIDEIGSRDGGTSIKDAKLDA